MNHTQSKQLWAWARALCGLAVGAALLAAGSWLMMSASDMPKLSTRGATPTVQAQGR